MGNEQTQMRESLDLQKKQYGKKGKKWTSTKHPSRRKEVKTPSENVPNEKKRPEKPYYPRKVSTNNS